MKSIKLTKEQFATLEVGEKIVIETEFGDIRAEIINGQILEGSDSVITHTIEYTEVEPLEEEDKEKIEGGIAEEGQTKIVPPKIVEAEGIEVYLDD